MRGQRVERPLGTSGSKTARRDCIGEEKRFMQNARAAAALYYADVPLKDVACERRTSSIGSFQDSTLCRFFRAAFSIAMARLNGLTTHHSKLDG